MTKSNLFRTLVLSTALMTPWSAQADIVTRETITYNFTAPGQSVPSSNSQVLENTCVSLDSLIAQHTGGSSDTQVIYNADGSITIIHYANGMSQGPTGYTTIPFNVASSSTGSSSGWSSSGGGGSNSGGGSSNSDNPFAGLGGESPPPPPPVDKGAGGKVGAEAGGSPSPGSPPPPPADKGGGKIGGSSPPPPPPPSTSCFVAGTLILMADGNRKPIETIELGDEIMAFDGFGGLQAKPVIKLFVHEDKAVIDVDGVKVTPEHRFLTEKGDYKAIGEMVKDGDQLVKENGDLYTVQNTSDVEDTHTVYNFTVETLHTYVAAGFRVHNRKE